jgi:voltage-gated potassium channel
LLTVGYGDRYPVTDLGRVLGGGLAIAGVITIGIVTAKISSFFLEQALRAGRAIVDTEQLKNHFVICGWMEDMHELLKHVLEFNVGLKPEQIVVVAHVPKTWIDDVRAVKGLEKVQFIVGEYYQEVTLRRAAHDQAKKVMILADRTPSQSGQIPSATEIDARTVMSAMTLSNIARGTMVAAEVLDPKMDQYLKLAAVSEIIYSNEYSRLLLANASGGTGVTNILFDLLDPSTSSFISTREIPSDCIGKPYSELQKNLDQAGKLVVIGILENTGNMHRIKEDALRKAQKTPDVRKLVENLKAVKGIRCNHPVFNPLPNYVVPEGALAIVVENEGEAQPNRGGWFSGLNA